MRVVAEELRGINYLLRIVHQEHGDPYPVSVVADVSDDLQTVELKGLDKPITFKEARAIREWLKKVEVKNLKKVRKGRKLIMKLK